MSKATWGLDVWEFDEREDGNGRIHAGKSRKGGEDGAITLTLNGRRLYQLQRFLDLSIEEPGPWMEKRALVLIAEELRLAVAKARRHETEERALRRMLAKRDALGVADSL